MKTAAWSRIIALGSAMIAGDGCGGRTMITHGMDAAPAIPDARASSAGDGAYDHVYDGADGGDAPADLGCFQAHRQSAPCPSDEWYAFQGDTRCFLCASSAEPGCSSMVSYHCMRWGDGLCYRRCENDDDCTDPCFPFCRKILFYGGGDHCGGSSKSVCLRADRDTCDPGAEQL
jgi:hypothetical protein